MEKDLLALSRPEALTSTIFTLSFDLAGAGTSRRYFYPLPLPCECQKIHSIPSYSHGLMDQWAWPDSTWSCNPAKTCISGSLGTKTTRKVIHGIVCPPGHYTDSRLKQSSGLPMKKSYLLVLELQPEVTDVLSGNVGGGWDLCTLSWPLYNSSVPPRSTDEEAYGPI